MERRVRVTVAFIGILVSSIFFRGATLVAQETQIPNPENPPFPVEVELRNKQHLSFGAFTVGSTGGTVSISPSGSRTATGSVVLLNMGLEKSYAIFDVTANPGTLIQIVPILPVFLDGPLSGAIELEINTNNDLSTGSTFITTQNPHPILVGGTLNLPSGGITAGMYNASFRITLIHE